MRRPDAVFSYGLGKGAGRSKLVLVANLAEMRREAGQERVELFLWLVERISATTPEWLAMLPGGMPASYGLRQVEALLREISTMSAPPRSAKSSASGSCRC